MNTLKLIIKKRTLLIILAAFFFYPDYSKGDSIDSLKTLLRKANQDTVKINLMNSIVKKYWNHGLRSSLDSAKLYVNASIELSKKINYKKGEADALYYQGKYEMSMNDHLDKATLYLLQSMAIYEQLKNLDGVAMCNLQLGVVSYELESFSDAIIYLKKSLTYKKIKPISSATAKYLIALCYSETDSINKAIAMFDIALKDFSSINNQMGALQCNTYIGKMYTNTGNYDKAIKQLTETIENCTFKNDSTILAPAFAFLATAYLKTKDYKNAIKYGEIAFKLVKITGSLLYVKESETTLHAAYAKSGDIKKGYYYLDKLNDLKDSIYNNTTLQRIGEMKSKYEYEQQLNYQKTEQEKKVAVANEEKRVQKKITLLVSLALVISALLLIVVYRNAQQKQKTNKLLSEQNDIIYQEQMRSEGLLLNILPLETASELKLYGKSEPKSFEMVTVLFTDFKNFTKMSEMMTPNELVTEINYCYSAFDTIITKHGIEKIKTIGDSYMCAGGLPVKNDTNPIDTVNAAIEIRDFMLTENKKRKEEGKLYFDVRIGLNTGPVVAGIVGIKKFAYDIWGDTVNIASRMESSGEPYKVNISGSTYELVKDNFICEYRGKVMAKNKGDVDMYFVERKV